MLTRLRHVAEHLRANLWLVPAMTVLLAIGLSLATLSLDERYGAQVAEAPLLFTGGPEGATAVLTAIASSMMGVTGVIFSITIVALTLASSQFGPRLLRGFIRDRSNQMVLGVFIGTFTFTLLTLRAVEHGEEATVPQITVNVAILLALASLAVLIYFVHHVATTIQADTIIALVSRDLHGAIEHLYPEGLGEELSRDETPRLPPRFEEEAKPVRAPTTGYVQAIDLDDVMKVVAAADALLRLDVRPGDFVVKGAPIGWLWQEGGIQEETVAATARVILVGRKPTAEQDAEFLIMQLVEVAVRALSPGINDPFTASRCVDRLSAALLDLSRRRFPSAERADAEGKPRIIARTNTWPGLVDAAYDQIRQHAEKNVAVTIRILEGLIRAGERLPRGDARAEPLRAQGRQVLEQLERAGFGREDVEEVKTRARKLERVVGALA